jgi:putative salt-induced outer membrane protein YdiY
MVKNAICALALAGLLTACSPGGAADLVVMRNGDRLTGDVVSMGEGVLMLETEYAGALALDWSAVEALRLAEALPVLLADGSARELEELPTRGVSLGDVVAIALPPPSPPPVRWVGRVDFGYGLAAGNRDTELGTLTILAERKRSDRYRLSALFDAARGESEGETTADRARVEGKYDRSMGDSAYRYLLAGAGYDRVRSIDLRAEVGAGLGRTLLDTERSRLSVEVGASYVRDHFADGTTESDAKLRLGETWRRPLGGNAELVQSLAALGALDELGDYTAEFVLAITQRLSDEMALTSKFVGSYDSRPAAGTERADYTLTTQLGLAFGG